MEIRECIFTQNDCYKAGRTIVPRGILVHSTAANNPWLRRYVGPDDGRLGVNANGNHWNRPGIEKCVHAFVGLDKNGQVCTYQTLPWNCRGWHAGGAANNTHIGFEICEDGLKDGSYFAAVYREAVELCAYLCRLFQLDPRKDGVLLCHSEGHARGIASNHADVMHWFPKHGKDMDDFRADVDKTMKEEETMAWFLKLGHFATKEEAQAALESLKGLLDTADVAQEADSGKGGESPESVAGTFQKGDRVVVKNGVTTWSNGKAMASWVRDGKTTFTVLSVEGETARIGNDKGAYTGTARIGDLKKAG